MEGWRKFLESSITEASKEDSIVNLTYGELKKEKHIKRLAKELEVFDLQLSDIPISTYPANDSEEVKKELEFVLSKMKDKGGFSDDDLEKTDEKPLEMFFDYLKDNDIKYKKDTLQKIYEDAANVSLKLKVRYNRPRPEQLGPLLGYDIKSIKTDTDNTPSFPSGHTTQAWTLAYYLSDKHPEHKPGFYAIAKKIQDSRVVRGAHYPSDNKEAKKIAKIYLFPSINL